MKATSAPNKNMDSCFRRNDGSGDRKENKVSHMNTSKNDEMKTSMVLQNLEEHFSEVRYRI